MSLQSDDAKMERALCSYENLSHKFKFEKKRDFKVQYANVYYARLQRMRKSLQDSASRKWGKLSQIMHEASNLRAVIT